MKITITIDGMMCGNCASRVTNALKNAGADDVVVSLENKTADIEYNPDTVSVEQLKTAVEDAGYDIIS